MEIILYTTHCPRCLTIKRSLDNAKIKYTEIDDVDLMLNKGFAEAPMVEIDGKIMGYKEANEWISKIIKES